MEVFKVLLATRTVTGALENVVDVLCSGILEGLGTQLLRNSRLDCAKEQGVSMCGGEYVNVRLIPIDEARYSETSAP